MKTKILILTILCLFSITSIFSQDRTTVTANNSDISDNLDLRAVASIFGDSENLEDFERRLNDPKAQISNLDLNRDNQVDYLRVIESAGGNTHLIIIQSVLGRDTFQDVATVEIEKDRNNRVQVQVVGDVFIYGDNYIYEPVYAYSPIIYNSFWVPNYRPYCSSWYWGYYPSLYIAWSPFPIYTYYNHIGIYINHNHYYNYVNYRRCSVAYNNYYNGRRGNAYERQYPNRSFSNRNSGYVNRSELVTYRNSKIKNTRNNETYNNTRNNSEVSNSPRPIRTVNGSNEIKGGGNTRSYSSVLSSPRPSRIVKGTNEVKGEETPRSYSSVSSSPRPSRIANGTYDVKDNETPRSYRNTRNNENPRNVNTQINSEGDETPRPEAKRNVQRSETTRSNSPSEYSQQRGNSQRTEGNSRGNRRS